MGHGIQLAFNEISLVLFTTLAPSGVVALMLMGAPLLFGRVSGEKARRIDCFMGIPLAVSMVGLVMSATHLGNPDNILYVFSRVGFSPLSNEVAGAVVFLALAGAYWLYSFARAPRTGVKRALTVALWCSGAAFLVLMAQAYSAETIVSWNTAYVPLNMVLNGLVGRPRFPRRRRLPKYRLSLKRFLRRLYAALSPTPCRCACRMRACILSRTNCPRRPPSCPRTARSLRGLSPSASSARRCAPARAGRREGGPWRFASSGARLPSSAYF